MDPFLGEIRAVGFSYAPSGWALCDGQLLNIAQNSALYALLGTTYGGNGTTNFALPNLQSRVIVGVGQGSGLSSYVQGQTTGAENVTLALNQLPVHNHLVTAQNSAASTGVPGSNYLGNSGSSKTGGLPIYASSTGPVTMASDMIQPAGGSQPLPIVQPVLPLLYIIATQGIFPSRP